MGKVLIKRQMKDGLQRDEGQGSQEMEAMGGAARREVRRKPSGWSHDGVLKLANKSRTSQRAEEGGWPWISSCTGNRAMAAG